MATIQTTPTPEQAKWIKENFKNYTNKEIADKFGILEYKVSVWFKSLGLNKINRGKKRIKIRQKKFETPKQNRFPAQYSNISREQHVDRILSMNI